MFGQRLTSFGIDPAQSKGMFLFGFLTVTAASLAVMLNALRKAPEGFEDETGFHIIPGRPRYSGASVLPRRSRNHQAVNGRLHLPLPASAAGHCKG